MMQYLLNIDAALAKLEKWCAVSLFAAAALMLLINILCRNFLGISFQGLLESSPRVLFWAVLLGASLGLKHRRHIRLDVALRFFDPALRNAAGRLSGMFGAIVMGTLFLASLRFVKSEIDMFGYQGWVAAILPVFFALSGLRFLIGAAAPGTGRTEMPPGIAPDDR